MEQRFLHQVKLQENIFRVDDNPGRCFRIPYLLPVDHDVMLKKRIIDRR